MTSLPHQRPPLESPSGVAARSSQAPVWTLLVTHHRHHSLDYRLPDVNHTMTTLSVFEKPRGRCWAQPAGGSSGIPTPIFPSEAWVSFQTRCRAWGGGSRQPHRVRRSGPLLVLWSPEQLPCVSCAGSGPAPVGVPRPRRPSAATRSSPDVPCCPLPPRRRPAHPPRFLTGAPKP